MQKPVPWLPLWSIAGKGHGFIFRPRRQVPFQADFPDPPRTGLSPMKGNPGGDKGRYFICLRVGRLGETAGGPLKILIFFGCRQPV
jgi:hypothetical protein